MREPQDVEFTFPLPLPAPDVPRESLPADVARALDVADAHRVSGDPIAVAINAMGSAQSLARAFRVLASREHAMSLAVRAVLKSADALAESEELAASPGSRRRVAAYDRARDALRKLLHDESHAETTPLLSLFVRAQPTQTCDDCHARQGTLAVQTVMKLGSHVVGGPHEPFVFRYWMCRYCRAVQERRRRADVRRHGSSVFVKPQTVVWIPDRELLDEYARETAPTSAADVPK